MAARRQHMRPSDFSLDGESQLAFGNEREKTTEELSRELFDQVTTEVLPAAPRRENGPARNPRWTPGTAAFPAYTANYVETVYVGDETYLILANHGCLRMGRPAAGPATDGLGDNDYGLAAGCIALPTALMESIIVPTLMQKYQLFKDARAKNRVLSDMTVIVPPKESGRGAAYRLVLEVTDEHYAFIRQWSPRLDRERAEAWDRDEEMPEAGEFM